MPSLSSEPPEDTSEANEHSPDPEREYRKLVLALTHESGFRLNFALFRHRQFRDQYVARLRQELAAQKVAVSVLDLHDTPRPVLLTGLEQHLRDTPAAEGMTRGVMVLGLEDKLGLAIAGLPGGADERSVLQTANLHRDLFPERCPCPVLFWLTESAMREFSTQAPDLWHWRAHTFRFFDPDGISESQLMQRAESGAIFGESLPYRTAKEMEDALALYQAALRRYPGAVAETNLEALELRDRLATLLKDLGRPAEAEPLMRHNLATRECLLGPEHPATLSSVNNLASLLNAKGDLAAAEPLFRRALAVRERVLGPEHPHTLTSVNNLAALLDAKGDLAGAEPLYRRALTMRERVLGSEHPNTLGSVNNLAGLLESKGDLAGAEPLYRRALADCERVLGSEHPNTLINVNNLAYLLRAKGDLAAAEPLFRRALTIRERVLGPEHPDTLISVNNLAALLYAKGDLAGALPLFERAVQGLLQKLGPDHPHTKLYQKNLASARTQLAKNGKS